ncbi:MAG: hypothetical protein RIR18_201 [Pseudomonadota bacterium]|jgi:phosphonate transport system substrate-binding protein
MTIVQKIRSKVTGLATLVLLGGFSLPQGVIAETYSFGVLSQRSAVLTAQYWNPILEYVHRKTGIELVLKLARSVPESNDAIEHGEYDFVYANTIFLPRMVNANYQVILRPRDEAIRGQLVTLDDSPVKTLKELEGKEIGFPAHSSFVGYTVPMDQLIRQNITVTPIFGGNQEGIMGQLKNGKVVAAGVNNQVMRDFANRENVKYRILWESSPFHNLPIAAHPRVSKVVVSAIKAAIDGMEVDPDGMKVLDKTAQVIKQPPPYGFRSSTSEDYKNYIEFYKNTLVKDIK